MAFALAHLAALIAIATLFYATGFVTEALAPRLENPALGRFVVRSAVGTVVWSYLLFGLACMGGFRGQVVLPLAGTVLAAALGWALFTRWQSFRQLASFGSAARRIGTGLLLSIPALAVLVPLTALGLSRWVGWDCSAYH